MQKMSSEELRARVVKCIEAYNENPWNFTMNQAMKIFESVDYDNPLKLEALRFMAELERNRY